MAENLVSESEPVTDGSMHFAVALRGYDRRQVDEYVQALQVRAARQAQALAEAEARLAERAPVPGPRASAAPVAVGTRIDKMLALAEVEAKAIRSAAGTEAEKIRQAARAVMEGSTAALREVESKAQIEARKIIAEARRQASVILDTHRAATEDLERIAAMLAEVRIPNTPVTQVAEIGVTGSFSAEASSSQCTSADSGRIPDGTGSGNSAVGSEAGDAVEVSDTEVGEAAEAEPLLEHADGERAEVEPATESGEATVVESTEGTGAEPTAGEDTETKRVTAGGTSTGQARSARRVSRRGAGVRRASAT